MKRYRPVIFDFDARAHHLILEVKEEWESKIKELHLKNKQNIINGLVKEFGEYNSEMKIKNFIDIGAKPLSIIVFHNVFFHQIRNAFVIGSYYPALTGTCALGERILNHLILKMRNYYTTSPEYKKVYKKDSFDDWDIAINVLKKWDILLPKVVEKFKELKEIRHKNIHFDYSTDYKDRIYALDAIKKMNVIINEQFSAFGSQPWFIPGTRGCVYIKKSYEGNPFVKEIYIPNCALVGTNHKIEIKDNKWNIIDEKYEDKEITDEEFVQLARKNSLA